MSLIDDYNTILTGLRNERERRYEAEYRAWQAEEAERGELLKVAIGVGVGAVTGGLGYLPGIAAGAGGALAGGGLALLPGGLTLPFLKGGGGGVEKSIKGTGKGGGIGNIPTDKYSLINPSDMTDPFSQAGSLIDKGLHFQSPEDTWIRPRVMENWVDKLNNRRNRRK